MVIRFRMIKSDEASLLREMIYEAIFIPEGEKKPVRSILDTPELARYHKEWGRHMDLAIMAEEGGAMLGLIWGRLFEASEPGYGFYNGKTPEIGLAVVSEQRGKGVGGSLIDEIAKSYKSSKVRAMSLSVDRRNRAVNLYLRKGFSVVREEGYALTMVKKL